MSIRPALFIGLGGTGAQTVSSVKRVLATTPVSTLFRYLVLDTDRGELGRIAEQYHREEIIDPRKEFLHLGGFNPLQLVNSLGEGYRHRFPWLGLSPHSLPDRPLEIGADARRQLGRLAAAHNAAAIASRVIAGLRDLDLVAREAVAVESRLRPAVYVITGSVGGTGSGIFQDVLCIVQAAYRRLAEEEAYLRPVIFAPGDFVGYGRTEPERRRYLANGAAFFIDLLRAAEKGSAPFDRNEFADPEWLNSSGDNAHLPPNWAFKPFNRALVVQNARDGVGNTGQVVQDGAEFCKIVGEMLAMMASSPADGKFEASWTNELTSQGTDPEGYGPIGALGALGMVQVEVPLLAIERYVSSRMLQESVDRIFDGTSPSTSFNHRLEAKSIAERILADIVGVTAAITPVEVGPIQRTLVDAQSFQTDMDRLTTRDQFAKADADPDDDEPPLDLRRLGRTALDHLIERVESVTQQTVDAMHQAFQDWFGTGVPQFPHAGRTATRTVYLDVDDALWETYRSFCGKHGLRAWVGGDDETVDGVIEFLHEELNASRIRARERRADLERRLAAAGSDLPDRITRLLGACEAADGVFARITGSAKKGVDGALTDLLGALRARHDLSVELTWVTAVEEVLTVVADLGRDRVTSDTAFWINRFARGGYLESPSLLRWWRTASYNARDLVRTCQGLANQGLSETIDQIRSDESALSIYLPPLDEVVRPNRTEGELSRSILAVLGKRQPAGNGVTGFADSPGWEALLDRHLAATTLHASLAQAASAWVGLQLRQLAAESDSNGPPLDLSHHVQNLPKEAAKELKDRLSPAAIPVFGRLRPSTKSADQLLVVTAGERDPERNPLLNLIGFGPDMGRDVISHSDVTRTILIRAQTMLKLSDFAWWSAYHRAYQEAGDLIVHLSRHGRTDAARINDDSELDEVEALCIAFGILLNAGERGRRWREELFTQRSIEESHRFMVKSPVDLDAVPQKGLVARVMDAPPGDLAEYLGTGPDADRVQVPLPVQTWKDVGGPWDLAPVRDGLLRVHGTYDFARKFVKFAQGDPSSKISPSASTRRRTMLRSDLEWVVEKMGAGAAAFPRNRLTERQQAGHDVWNDWRGTLQGLLGSLTPESDLFAE